MRQTWKAVWLSPGPTHLLISLHVAQAPLLPTHTDFSFIPENTPDLATAWLIIRMVLLYGVQTGLKLLGSSNNPMPHPQVSGTIGGPPSLTI